MWPPIVIHVCVPEVDGVDFPQLFFTLFFVSLFLTLGLTNLARLVA